MTTQQTENSTATASEQRATGADLARQITVSLSAVVAIVGALYGSGMFGGDSMPEAAGGAFAADATPVAPGGPAFSIWSVIYFGLFAYAVWQWLPKQAAAERHRRTGVLIAVSMLLNALWLITVQLALLWFTLVVMVVLLITLIIAFVRLRRTCTLGVVDAVITDGTVGLYLGWIIVATVANVAAVLAAEVDVDALGDPDGWAVVVLVVAALIGAAFTIWNRGRIAPSLAMVWGLTWIGIARVTGELVSTAAANAAFSAAGVVLIATIVARTLSVVKHRRTTAATAVTA